MELTIESKPLSLGLQWNLGCRTPAEAVLCVRCSTEDVFQPYLPGQKLGEFQYYSRFEPGRGWFSASKDPFAAIQNSTLSNLQHLPWADV